MDEKKILKLGKRQKPVVSVASGTSKYVAPSQAKDVISREATDANTVAQRKREKAARRKQLAYYMAKTTGGNVAQFEKVINSEDWDDLDVQEMLLEDRFAKYRDASLVNTSEEVRAKVQQTNKNATTRKLERIQSEREFLGKQTGAISSNYEENSNLLTPETVVAGKIKAAGLENELAGVMNKYDSYLSMSSQDRQNSFSKEEISIFTTISNTGLTPSKLTSKKSVLDFGGDGGSFDEATGGNEMLSPVEFEYATDDKTPHAALASIFGSYRESLSGATYDVLPINKKETSEDLLTSEFSLQAPTKYPDYMQPARGMKGITVQQQQQEALGLPDNANVQEYFDNLAEQYIDPSKLEYMTPAEKGKAIRLISMQISKMLPSRLKAVSVQNATSIQANDDKFNELVEQYGVDEAVAMVGKGSGKFIPPTAAYTAYPSPHELVASINSSKLREFAEGVVKRGMTKKGFWTDDESQVDTMSTLLTYGTHNLSYNNFDKQDDEYQRATVKRAALTELPKQLGRIYGISDTAVSRKSWGGGLSLNYDVLEKTLDEQLDESDVDTLKPQLDRELEHKPATLDRYARDELARTVDVYFQPAGDLAADYVDNNMTQVDEYMSLQADEVELNDDVGAADSAGEDSPTPADTGSAKEYEGQTGLEALTRDGPGPVDDSFATAAPSVDMQAVEGVREGANTNQRASHGNNLGESVSTTGATSGSRLGSSVAARAAVKTEFKVPAKAVPAPTKTETIVKVVQVDAPAIVATQAEPTPALGTRDERLSQARESYQAQNPDIAISIAPQGSQEWLDDRKKLVTASDVTRTIRSDKTRNTFVGEKAMENWGMTTTKPFQSEDIERGHRLEEKIRKEYEKQTDTEILEMGLLQNKGFPGGASLDGLVTKDGAPTKKGVEFKAPREFRNFAEYHDQTQMQMAVGNLDSVDIMQGVEVDGKLRTQTQTVNKDLQWQKRNRSKIEQAQESIKRNAAMTQEEFLAAQATMAADKSGKYGFLVSANKEDVEEAVGGKGAGGNGGGKGAGTGPALSGSRGRSNSGGNGNLPPESGNNKRGWLSQAYNTVKEVTQFVDKNAQELAADFREDIGKPLDYGVNPGQYLANNIALRGAGVSDRDARSATLSGASMAGAMELGDYSGAINQVVGTLGLEDLATKRELADNPTERALRIVKNAKDRNMSPMATAEALRRSGLEGFGTLANLTSDEQANVSAKTKEQPQATPGAYAQANMVVNTGAEAAHRRSMAAVGVNAGISKDAGFAKSQMEKLKNIPESIGSAINEVGNSLTGLDGSHASTEGGEVYTGKVDRSGAVPVDVNVTVRLEGNIATVEAKAGNSSATSQKGYKQSTND
ncbi:YqaJ viral recombinase family protein [Pseudomonas brenneri]|uniref:YqaJ viral recombinase family protein n=1 Tax=Pseudomonas brenneri TaxID=129817 RepID=UPI0025A20AC2|nr:YqaJ viral recombinase family protein [Pseudomonas brenneri]WJM94076.1 YqaJ viral recombinase family protein [Pseudomonas brenneri]